jgi:PleD family two-component response regulator
MHSRGMECDSCRLPGEKMASTILIVEDEVELAQVLRDYLEKSGFRVQLATSGAAAVSTFRHSPADLVVLDLNLPGLDGLDVAPNSGGPRRCRSSWRRRASDQRPGRVCR